jgi:hypothetical protein
MKEPFRVRDRRNAMRLDVKCPCAHTRFDDGGNPYDQRPSKSLNLTAEGVGLHSRFSVDVGEMLKITMALGDDLITFRGKVIYVNFSQGQGFQYGISIKDIDKMDRIALTRYIYYFNPSKTQ